MIKVIPPNAWGDLLPPPEPVKAASTGIGGHDFSVLLKRASHPLALWVKDHPPRPGEVYVHSVAMGSTEKFGCFFAGAPVQTEHGLRPIEDVREGDLVLTHKNRYRPVTKTFTAAYSGRRVTLKASGMPEPIVSTAEHPFWVVRRAEFGAADRCEAYLKRKGKTKLGAVDDVVATKATFVRADELVEGDYLIVPTAPQPIGDAEIAADPYVLGVYLAEGCITREYRDTKSKGKPRTVLLTVGVQDEPVLREVAARIPNRLGRQPSLTSDKGVRASISSNALAAECLRLFGNNSTTKRIPPEVFAQSRAWKTRFIAGYLDGDGCVVKTGTLRCQGAVIASTASLNLALDLQRLLATVDVSASIVKAFNRHHHGCFGKKDHVIYQVSIGRGYSRPLLAACKRLAWPETAVVTDRKQGAAQIGTGYLLVPLTAVTVDEVAGETKYNFEVAEDNSYVVYSSVHNCNRNADGYSAAMLARDHKTFEKYARWYLNHNNQDPAKSYGVVRKAIYDPELQRVDTITALNGNKQAADANGGLVAERTLNKMAAGQDVAVSMSTRVPYDVCSSCGHKAKHRGEYCTKEAGCPHGGCRHNLGRVYEDGHHLHVDNPICSFFDLSDVSDTRGADRTAFITGKVAGHYAPGGAELAEMMGLVPPEHLLTPEKLAQLRTLRKVAALAPKAAASLPWAETLAVREKLATHTPRYSVPGDDAGRWRLLGDLAAAGVVLPPAEWLRVVTGAPADKCAAALAGGVDVERDLLSRPDLHDLLDGPFDIRISAKAAYAWMAPTPASRGREAALAVVKAASQVAKAAVESPLPPAQRAEVAARYCAYLGAATAPHENFENFPLLLATAASHTRPHA